jgi:uncharacterized protein
VTGASAAAGSWSIEPAAWTLDGGVLIATSRPRTDFWRTTHYGFIRHTGHRYGRPVPGDFTAIARFTGDYREQYDQAGLMLSGDERNWIKAGVELVDGVAWLSAVVTREMSDWSLAVSLDPAEPVWLRMRRRGDAVSVEHSPDGASWRLVRMASLPPGADDDAGPMLACPEADAFTARFDQISVVTG